jgi:transcriptional regulator with XRE-family HTH domain
MSLGKRLKKARNNKDLTQEEAAKRLGITFQALSNYERDYRDPDTTLLAKIAELYDVTTDYLLGRSDKRKETLNDEPTPQEIEEIFQNQVMYQGVPMTEEEKESVKDFIQLAIKTIRAKKRGENNNA